LFFHSGEFRYFSAGVAPGRGAGVSLPSLASGLVAASNKGESMVSELGVPLYCGEDTYTSYGDRTLGAVTCFQVGELMKTSAGTFPAVGLKAPPAGLATAPAGLLRLAFGLVPPMMGAELLAGLVTNLNRGASTTSPTGLAWNCGEATYAS
jgi:hypothetical protein